MPNPPTEGFVMATPLDRPFPISPVTPGSLPLRSPMALMSAFETYEPSVDALWRQFEDNFEPAHAPKSQPMRELNLELTLAAEEAHRGGHFSIDVPVGQICGRCEGSGTTGFFDCDLCEGHGMRWETARVIVFISPSTRSGTSIPISLRHLGVKNLFLNVHVRVTQ